METCIAEFSIGPKVVPVGGSYLEFYKVIQKGSTLGPMGRCMGLRQGQDDKIRLMSTVLACKHAL